MKTRVIVGAVCLSLFSLPVCSVQAQSSFRPGPGNPLLQNAIQPAVLFDSASHTYRMWFIALGAGVREAVSEDGQSWSVRDSVVLTGGQTGAYDQYVHALCVVAFGDSLAMYYTCSNDGVMLVVARAVSADGIHWLKSPDQPVLASGPQESWDAHGVGADAVILRGGVFRMWYGGSNGVSVQSGYAESYDGVTWSKYPANPVLPHGAPGAFDEREAGIMGVDWHGTFACAVYQSITAGGSTTFSVATSRDGIAWTKDPWNPVYTPLPSGWDAYAMGGGTLLREGDSLRFWYCGYSGSWSIGHAILHVTGAGPAGPDPTTRALWHLDESSGSLVADASGNGLTGTAVGTMVVPGQFGNARAFNGSSDYVTVPSSNALDFGDSSFTVGLWFKTTNTEGVMVRRGLAPVPGYSLGMHLGRLTCQLGDRLDSAWPDTILMIMSTSPMNDGAWHSAGMVRDRATGTLSLYADGVLAAPPIADNLTFPITNTRPLTMGRWENDSNPGYWAGTLDEVRISGRQSLKPAVGVSVQPAALDFGWVRLGATATLPLTVGNTGNRDTLRIGNITSTVASFGSSTHVLTLPPFASVSVPITYTPSAAGRDTARLSITSNAPGVSLPLSGRGFAMLEKPIISLGSVVPSTYYQVRIDWIRSLHDTAGNPDPVVQYSLWRQAPTIPSYAPGAHPVPADVRSSPLLDTPWEFIETIPAAQFDHYSTKVQALIDYRAAVTPNVFIVAAHTRSVQVFVSDPDTILVDPPRATSIRGPESAVQAFALEQNYPNPFNPSTTIRFGLPGRSAVTLSVYTTLGQQVASLVDGVLEAGVHEVRFDATGLASGIYFYRLHAGSFIQTRKFLLLR